MSIVVSIADIFREQFGFKPPIDYVLPGLDKLQRKLGLRNDPKFNITKDNGQGGLDSFHYQGYNIPTKVEEPEFGGLGGEYYNTDEYGREYFMPIKLGGYQLWFPVISLQLQRGIVETSMTERTGNVIEIVNNEGLNINVKGLIVGINNTWPEEDYQLLMELYAETKSLTVESVITNIAFQKAFPDLKEAPRVVVRKVDISPKTGVKHVIPYEMNLISDLIFDLEIA